MRDIDKIDELIKHTASLEYLDRIIKVVQSEKVNQMETGKDIPLNREPLNHEPTNEAEANKEVIDEILSASTPATDTPATDTNASIHKIIHDNYVYIHINYSKENKNPEVMRRLHNPARFGFPVFVILDKEGNPIHIQNSAYLEEGKGYSTKKVEEFLLNWTEDAINTLK